MSNPQFKLSAETVNEWINEPLDAKIERTKMIITRFYDALDGRVHLSDSGGKDSVVQRHIARLLYPDIPAVHAAEPTDPDTMKFIKSIDNLTVVTPKKTYAQIIKDNGYPVVSKEVSTIMSRYNGAKARGDTYTMNYRLTGEHRSGKIHRIGVLPQKWHFLIDAPFKISEECCRVIKKNPLAAYEKKHNTRPFVGVQATESNNRLRICRKHGCTTFNKGHEQCRPLSFWTEADIWRYIKLNELEYSPIYDRGETRTGCIGCMFGCHYDKTPNRFQRLYHNFPKLYDYYINTLDQGMVLDFLGIDYTPIARLDQFL